MSTQVRMNCLKDENKSIDGQCVTVIANCNLLLHSLSFLSINQMMGKESDCICKLQLFLLPLLFIYIKGRLHLNEIVLKIELSC